MEIFVFSSKNLTNIWAGIGARRWAVADTGNDSTLQGRATKSKNMKIGSFGILYCIETQSLTTPFIIYSKPNPNEAVENIWPERWVLPFKIFPLGSPDRQIHKDRVQEELPIFRGTDGGNFGTVFHIQAITAFSPTTIGTDDWEILMARLAI